MALCASRAKGVGLGKAAVDFDGNDASSLVQFEGRWSIKDRIAAQTGQRDKNAVFDASRIGISVEIRKRMIVTAHLRQHETQVGNVSRLRYGKCGLDGNPRAHLVAFDLDRRFEADIVLKSKLGIELAAIDLKRHKWHLWHTGQSGTAY